MLKLTDASVKLQNNIIRFHDITIHRGEIVGLSGPSGCGKSTLAMAMAGIYPLHQGQLQHSDNQQHQGWLQTILCKRQPNPVQWVCQQPEFAFNPRWPLQRSLTESHAIDNKQLGRYKIDPSWLSRLPHELSGGELQRLNLVRALAPSTTFLLCDEITAQLDPLTQQSIWQALCEDVAQHNLGMLVISHDQALLDAICDRVITF